MMPTPLIKICGVRTAGDVEVCQEEDVAYVGFNLFPPSPRFLTWEQAKTLRQSISPPMQAVAVMVRPDAEELRRAVEEMGADIIQLHGADVAYLRSFRPPAVSVWLAHGVGESDDLTQLGELIGLLRSTGSTPGAVVIDAKIGGQHGGTGRSPPWSLLARAKLDLPLILAGGLTAANVNGAISTVQPFAVDVAGGVEREPGIKDPNLIRAFVRSVRLSRETKQGEGHPSP